MPGQITRKELKQDNVALNVEKTVDYVAAHRQRFIRIGGIALAVVVVVAATVYYRNAQHDIREQALADALATQNATVGPAQPNGGLNFPTQEAKKSAAAKAYDRIISEYGGSAEGYVAEYSEASLDIDSGKLDVARKKYQDVADHAHSNYASLAKLALAQLDFAENRTGEAQTLLKDLQDHPTDLVSKNQAIYALAKGLTPKQPEEARKLLLSLAGNQSDISQLAVTALQDLPAK